MRVYSYTINVHGLHFNPQVSEIQEHLTGISMVGKGLRKCMNFSLNAGTVLVNGYDENNSNNTLCFHSAINFKIYLNILSLI